MICIGPMGLQTYIMWVGSGASCRPTSGCDFWCLPHQTFGCSFRNKVEVDILQGASNLRSPVPNWLEPWPICPNGKLQSIPLSHGSDNLTSSLHHSHSPKGNYTRKLCFHKANQSLWAQPTTALRTQAKISLHTLYIEYNNNNFIIIVLKCVWFNVYTLYVDHAHEQGWD